MRVEFKFNEPYYTLELSEIDDGVLQVLSFEGEDAISRTYEYHFELLSEQPDIDPDKILNKKATFIVSLGEEEPLKIHGIIRRFEQRGRGPDYISYSAVLVPRFWWTTLNHQSQIFQEMDVEQIVSQVLEDAGFAGSDFEFQLDESYPKSDYIVQYRESDFDFINRWLEHYGICYYFDQSDDKDKIIFSDANDAFPAIESPEEVSYNPNRDPLSSSQTVSEIVYQGSVATGSSRLKDYNYLYPNKQLEVESSLNGDYPGTFYDYGDHFADEKAGDLLVNVRNEEQLCLSKTFHGMSDCRFFRPGYRFTLAEHYRDDWNAEYILTQLRYVGTQRGLFSRLGPETDIKPTYENYFEAIPSDIPFRPARITKKPKIYGIMNARVDASGDGQYAEINDQGEYKVILPFDLSGNKDGEASKFIRMAQPYAGPDYGMHFPLHKGSEVLLTFIDGDPDRPIIVGTPPNPANASPVTTINQSQSVIRTAGNNEIIIEDQEDSQQIHIKQVCGNEILMDGKKGSENIQLRDPSGNEIVMDAKAESITANDHGGNKILMNGKGGSEGITIQDKYGNEINLDAVQGVMTLFSPSHLSKIELGKSILLDTKSDKNSLITGSCKVTVGGATMEHFTGVKQSTFVGGKQDQNLAVCLSNTVGLKSDISYAKDVSKNYAIRERKSENYIKYDSEKYIHLIGGPANDSNVMIDKDAITISNKGDNVLDISGTTTLAAKDEIVIEAPTITFKGKNFNFESSSMSHFKKGMLKHKNTVIGK